MRHLHKVSKYNFESSNLFWSPPHTDPNTPFKLSFFEPLTGDTTKEILNKGIWNSNIDNLGYNFRLPDLNCALGI